MTQTNTAFARVEQILPFIQSLSVTISFGVLLSIISVFIFFLKNKIDKSNIKTLFVFIDIFKYSFLPLIIIIYISEQLISNNGDIKFLDPLIEGVLTTKIIILLFIFINYVYVLYHMFLLKKSIKRNEIDECENHIIIVAKYFLPLNLILLSIYIYLGVVIGTFNDLPSF